MSRSTENEIRAPNLTFKFDACYVILVYQYGLQF